MIPQVCGHPGCTHLHCPANGGRHTHLPQQRYGSDSFTLTHTHAHTHAHTHTGQFYSLLCKANSSTTAPELVKSVVYLTFFDEPDSRVEYNYWQYWYSLQANPNQKAFDIGQ